LAAGAESIFSLTLLGLAAAAALAGLIRGFSGFGAGMVMAPAFSLLVEPVQAVPVLVLLEMLVAIPLLPGAMPLIEGRRLLALALPAGLAVPLGGRFLATSNPDVIRTVISLVVLAFVVAFATGRRYEGEPSLALFVLTGALSGTLTGICGIGGPPVILLLLAGPWSTAKSRATLIGFFAVTQLVAAVTYTAEGLVDGAVAWRTLLLAPVFLLSARGGARLFTSFDERTARRAMLILLALLASSGLIFGRSW
jgi:uncharacterized membrane protein YfcA